MTHLRRLPFCLIALVLLPGCLGAGAPPDRPPTLTDALIPPEQLPPGWHLLPEERFPISDKMAWWKTNPMIRCFDPPVGPEEWADRQERLGLQEEFGQARELLGVFYVKGRKLSAVMVFAARYSSPEAAQQALVAPLHNPNQCVRGGLFRRDRTMALWFEMPRDAPDYWFFVEYYGRLVDLSP
jgi:hypothetical protein